MEILNRERRAFLASDAADGTVYIGSGDNNLYAVGVAPPPRAPAKLPATTRPAWAMFHHDRAHTGLSDFDTSANTGILK